MDLRLDILPAEDTTSGEVASLAQALRQSLDRAREVDRVEPVRVAAPDAAKGLLDEAGGLLLGIPSSGITAVLDLIKAVICRPGQPPVQLKVSAGSVEVTFDPKTLSPEKLGALVTQLKTGLAQASPA